MTHFIQDLQKKARWDYERLGDYHEEDGEDVFDPPTEKEVKRLMDSLIHDTALATLEEMEREFQQTADNLSRSKHNRSWKEGANCYHQNILRRLSQLKEAITNKENI